MKGKKGQFVLIIPILFIALIIATAIVIGNGLYKVHNTTEKCSKFEGCERHECMQNNQGYITIFDETNGTLGCIIEQQKVKR